MKNVLVSVIITLLTLSVCAQKTDSVFYKIEAKIIAAADGAYTQGPKELEEVSDSLGFWRNTYRESYLNYWYVYSLYMLGVYYSIKDKQTSEQFVQKATGIIKSITNKTSEDYVLLGSLTAFSINFHPAEKLSLSGAANSYFVKAIELDKNNLRAYYCIGRSDFYRPKEYGGGLVVESNLLKALSLKNKNSNNPLAPTWGREDVYKLLITYYVREEKKQDALLFCKKALQEFPQSKQVIEIQKKIQL